MFERECLETNGGKKSLRCRAVVCRWSMITNRPKVMKHRSRAQATARTTNNRKKNNCSGPYATARQTTIMDCKANDRKRPHRTRHNQINLLSLKSFEEKKILKQKLKSNPKTKTKINPSLSGGVVQRRAMKGTRMLRAPVFIGVLLGCAIE